MSYVHNGKNHVEANAAYSPVELGISALCTGKHDVEHKERKQNAKHTDKLEHGSR
jgi:hypothetical protein